MGQIFEPTLGIGNLDRKVSMAMDMVHHTAAPGLTKGGGVPDEKPGRLLWQATKGAMIGLLSEIT